MGQDIKIASFTIRFHSFQRVSSKELETLKEVLQMPGFGQGSASVGAELEYYIVDEEAMLQGLTITFWNPAKARACRLS